MAFLWGQQLTQEAREISALSGELCVQRFLCRAPGLGTKEGRWLWATRGLKADCAPPATWGLPLGCSTWPGSSLCSASTRSLSPGAGSTVFPGQGSWLSHGAARWRAVTSCSWATPGVCLLSRWWSGLLEWAECAAEGSILCRTPGMPTMEVTCRSPRKDRRIRRTPDKHLGATFVKRQCGLEGWRQDERRALRRARAAHGGQPA